MPKITRTQLVTYLHHVCYSLPHLAQTVLIWPRQFSFGPCFFNLAHTLARTKNEPEGTLLYSQMVGWRSTSFSLPTWLSQLKMSKIILKDCKHKSKKKITFCLFMNLDVDLYIHNKITDLEGLWGRNDQICTFEKLLFQQKIKFFERPSFWNLSSCVPYISLFNVKSCKKYDCFRSEQYLKNNAL